MKIDRTDQSPNFNERSLPISQLVLHYTGMETGQAALERLCDADAKVSAHYIVFEDGRISQLVEEEKRAWHAGVGNWRGISDINSSSIGIEIVNGGHNFPNADDLPPYPDEQINAVIALSKTILERHEIQAWNVIGHSDLAPERKEDPGEHFPWSSLAAAGIGLWAEFEAHPDTRILFEPGDRDRGVSIIQQGLAQIGYDIAVTGQFDERTKFVMTAFQRHWRPSNIPGVIDMDCLQRVGALVRLLP
ncbi:N-acetylmuramoyl-L-alanine amidase [Litorimonas haliclonae]|uniref:peptidoglycan recognition protein family protein n=1 Tax=Litorimonas haliclonae TaxID=2081977 RepID=UPI0039EF54E1